MYPSIRIHVLHIHHLSRIIIDYRFSFINEYAWNKENIHQFSPFSCISINSFPLHTFTHLKHVMYVESQKTFNFNRLTWIVKNGIRDINELLLLLEIWTNLGSDNFDANLIVQEVCVNFIQLEWHHHQTLLDVFLKLLQRRLKEIGVVITESLIVLFWVVSFPIVPTSTSKVFWIC